VPAHTPLRHLPLLLVAAMLAIAVALELALFGHALLWPKSPLAALLALAAWRARRPARSAGPMA